MVKICVYDGSGNPIPFELNVLLLPDLISILTHLEIQYDVFPLWVSIE